MNWKSAANTHLMPWLMIQSIKGFWEGYLRGQESYSEQAVAHLAQHVPVAMEDSLSHMKRKKLAAVMAEVGGRMKQVREQNGDEIDPQALFDTFLNGPGGSELQLSIWGSFGSTPFRTRSFGRSCSASPFGKDTFVVRSRIPNRPWRIWPSTSHARSLPFSFMATRRTVGGTGRV